MAGRQLSSTTRSLLWAALATIAAGGVLYHAYDRHKQFYPAVVYIVNSNILLTVLYVALATYALATIRVFQAVLFGQLRTIEVERLYEKFWFAFTETLLAVTVFRNDFTFPFVSQFVFLLVTKLLHWLIQERVDFMQQTLNINWKFHARILAASGLATAIDTGCCIYSGYMVYANGPSLHLFFAFEYIILAITMTVTFGKYILNIIDLRHEDAWEAKPMLVFALELTGDFIGVILYVMFFVVLTNFYGIPLYIIRDLVMTVRSFLRKIHSLVQARRAIHYVDTRYPSATPEELANDRHCSICRDEMTSAKKLPCGHIFHVHCIRTWLRQQQTCPTCRADVLRADFPPRHAGPVRPQQPGGPFPPHPPAWQAPGGAHPGQAAPLHHQYDGHAAAPAHHQAAQPDPRHQQHPQQQPQGAGGGNTPTEGGASPGGGAQGGHPAALNPHGMPLPPPFWPGAAAGDAGHMPAPPPPFPPFMPPGFVPFAFQPPPDEIDFAAGLDEMVETELTNMEADERAKVAKRVAFLRRFRNQLDRMIAVYGQYEQLAGQAHVASDIADSSSSSSDPTSDPTGPAPSSSDAASRHHDGQDNGAASTASSSAEARSATAHQSGSDQVIAPSSSTQEKPRNSEGDDETGSQQQRPNPSEDEERERQRRQRLEALQRRLERRSSQSTDAD